MKYKVLVISKYDAKVIHTSFVPRIGDKIALFHQPLPVVTEVIPVHEGMLPVHKVATTLDGSDIDAVCIVD